MKRAIRGISLLLALALCIYLFRAAGVWRAYDMAQTWNPVTESVPWWAFLSPEAQAASRHGVWADVVFVRVPVSFWATRGAPMDHQGIRASAPDCHETDWFRYDPRRIAPSDLAACYGRRPVVHRNRSAGTT